MKEKTKFVLEIIVLVTIVAIIALSLLIKSCDDHQSVQSNIPDVSLSGELGYSPTQSDSIAIQAATGYEFTANNIKQDIELSNPKENNYNFVISIYLGDGTLLYKSKYIKPGESVQQIELSQELAAGIYKDSVILYQFCPPNNNEVVSQCEFPIEIRCVN